MAVLALKLISDPWSTSKINFIKAKHLQMQTPSLEIEVVIPNEQPVIPRRFYAWDPLPDGLAYIFWLV